ncbi:cupin domain-containing protein [Compostibacter hankyongensis]|uniref:Cupin domain-containing protein n=1 Tax=Compostibacter hankyongensis TaxID=1007089 RepID=A0ABP8FV78_9BACT
MKEVTITPLPVINKDDRGSTLKVPNDRTGNFILCYRKAGTSSGRHYHTGKSPYKDPEVLYLLSGTALFRWYALEEGPEAMRQQEVNAPARVAVPVNVWHELQALTDCSFWEMNSLEDVQEDSVRIEYKS